MTMASRPERATRPGTPQERWIRRSWLWLAGAFCALAVLVIVRIFPGPPQPIDIVLGALVLVVGAAGVVNRRAIGDLDAARRQEAETFARILQGLSRSVSPDAIVGAIVADLGAAAGADHTVVVRLRPESPILEATLVSTRPGVPSSTTMLPVADLEDPEAVGGRAGGQRAPLSIPIESDGVADGDDLQPSIWSSVRGPRVAPQAAGPSGNEVGLAGLQPIVGPPAALAPAAAGLAASAIALGMAGATPAVASVPVRVRRPSRVSAASSSRIAERIAARVRTVYGFKNTVAAPLETDNGVVGAIVLSRRTSEPWSPAALRVLAGAAVEASAALERAYSHRQAEARASTDALTGLPNRRYFDEFCGLLARRRRADDAVGVLMIDIDHFKRLNDEFGHPVGDQVLRAVAGAITRAVREGDVPARFGGEEFAVLLRNPEPGIARDIAERVRSAVASLDLSVFGPRGVTVSIGYAVAREKDQSIPDLVDQADQALYRAKRAGRDRVVAA